MTTRSEQKELPLAYALWFLSVVGICGVQRLYLGQIMTGLFLLFTFGLCGIAQVVDLFLLPGAVKEANQKLALSEQSSSDPSPATSIRASQVSSISTLNSPVNRQAGIGKSSTDEPDDLLKQAQESVNRTKTPKEF